MANLRGFGLTFDLTSGGFRNWYVDEEGAQRWADNDELMRGFNGLRDESDAALEKERAE